MTRLRTPIVDGHHRRGRLGRRAGDRGRRRRLALENAVYSVISPEGCASILWRTADEAPDGGRSRCA